MGRIRTKLIKNVSNTLYKDHSQVFTKDFNENKKLIEQFAELPSKKMRNVIAGSVTRMRKADED